MSNENYMNMNYETNSTALHMNINRKASLNEIITSNGGSFKSGRFLAELCICSHTKRKLSNKKYFAMLEEEQRKEDEAIQKSIDEHGEFYVSMWSRDCDCVEETSAHSFKSLVEYDEFIEDCCEYADGPMNFTIISKDAYESFQPETRDRVLEAFENGSNYFV